MHRVDTAGDHLLWRDLCGRVLSEDGLHEIRMSRKYRHHGYQDRDWEEGREREDRRNSRNADGGFLNDEPQRSSRDPRERIGPRPTEPQIREEVFRCHLCGQAVSSPESVGREDTCPNCSADLWCCRGCTFFDPQARFECRQDIPERVKRKDKRNDCDLFKPRMVLDTSGRSKAGSGFFGTGGDETSRKAFEALFGED